MPHLALSLLGPFQATLDDQPVSGFESTKVRALLAYLAVEADRPHARPALAGLLWPDRPDSTALTNLRRALANLRQCLGDRSAGSTPPFLLATHQTIQFNTASDYRIDVRILEQRHRHAQRLMRQDGPAHAAIRHLQSAADLCRGSFLAEFSVDSAPFEEWAVLKREQINRQVWSVLHRLATYYERSGDYARAAACTRQQLQLEPWHEECLRHLLRMLALDGQRAAALVQYKTFRDLLHKELDIDPTQETTALYEQIRDGLLDPAGVAEAHRRALGQARPVPGYPPSAAPFVGREAEIERLDSFLEAARGGRGQVVFITGDAGSGKTALLQEFVRRATATSEDLVAAWGRCEGSAGIGDPYLPFRGILSSLAASAAAPGHPRPWIARRALVDVLLDHGPDLIDRLVPRAALLQGIDRQAVSDGSGAGGAPGQDRLEDVLRRRAAEPPSDGSFQPNLSEQITSVLQALASRRTLILALDDLQWADAASISLLFHLGRHVEASRILIAGAYRPADVALGRPIAGLGWARHPLDPVVLELQRRYGEIGIALRPEGRRFVDALLNTEPNRLGEPFRATLVHRTAGHPLFTVELLRSLREQGGLVRDQDGLWVKGPELDWDRMPARVEAVIAERIRRLDSDWQDLLAAASVQGEEFSVQVVARVLGLDEGMVTSILSGPLGRQHRLVQPQSTSRAGERLLSTYRFRHILFQSYLYGRLDTIEHTRLHQATAQALESLLGDQPGALAAMAPRLAWHYRQAGLVARAVGYLQQAARRSVELSANREALAHLEQALELLQTLPETAERDEQEVTLRLAMYAPLVASESYGSPRLRRSNERLQALCQRLGESPQHMPVHMALAGYSSLRAEFETALTHAKKALALAEQQGAEGCIVWARQVIGLSRLCQGRPLAARRHMETTWDVDDAQHQAMLPVRGSDPRVVGHAWNAWALWLLGYPDQARRCSQEGLNLARTLNHPYTLALALLIGGIHLAQLRREPGEIAPLLEEMAPLTARHAMPHMEALANFYHGWLLAHGEPEGAGSAIEQMQQALADWRATGMKSLGALYATVLADACLAAGRWDEAQRFLDQALALAEETGERFVVPEIYRLQGELLARRAGNPGAGLGPAESRFRRALDLAHRQQARSLELRAAISLARLGRAQGFPEKDHEAQVLLSGIYGWFTEGFDTPDLQEAGPLRAAPA